MATVVEPQSRPGPTRAEARVEAEIGRTAAAIRRADALAGAAAVAVVALGYAVAAMLLDRALELPEWVRQVGLGGFLLAAAGVTYALVVRPLRAVVNPRYAARRVEATAPDARNALINWVDLRDRDLPQSVRSAVGAEAAAELADADPNRAVDTRRLVWLGCAAGLLFAVLGGLFVVAKPPQFFSLLRRAFNPFTPTAIASRTQLTLVDPAAGDATVTAGDPLTVAVDVGGSLPDPDSPDRLRLQVRYSQDPGTAYDELPLIRGDTRRDWSVRVPDYVVQNGFWYRVAGGDAVTPEHRITVRSRPLFKEAEARYEYPAYTRLQPEVGREYRLEALRGTRVTLTVATNRELRSGRLLLSNKPDAIPGEVVGDAKDSLRFTLKLTADATYRLAFTAASGESSDPTPSYPIKVLADQVPTLTLDQPAEPEPTVPLNGLLAIDGVAADDFGLTAAVVRLRLVGDNRPTLPARPYDAGKPLKRDADGSFPTRLEVKDSVRPDQLTDEGGKPAGVKEGDVLEVWLEATDNCTEPQPNAGRSAVRRVKVGPPVVAPEPKKEQDKAAADRKAAEQQHRRDQQKRLDAENRDPNQPHPENVEKKPQGQQAGEPGQPNQGGAPMNTDGQQQQTGGDPANGQKPPPGGPSEAGKQPDPNAPNPMPADGQKPDPNQPMPPADGSKPPEKGSPQDTPGQKPDPANPPQNGNAGGNPMSDPRAGGDSAKPDPDLEKKAQQAAEELRKQEEQKQQPGDGRGNDAAKGSDAGDSPPPAEPKAGQPPPPGDAAQPKPGDKGDAAANDPQTPSDAKKGDAAAQPKGAGQVEQPPEPSAQKPQPGDGQPGADQKPDQSPTGDTPKNEPVGGQPGQEKSADPKAGGQPGSPDKNPKEPPSDPAQQKPEAGTGDKPKDAEPGQGKNAEPGKPDPKSGDTGSEKPMPGGNDAGQPDAAQKPKPAPGSAEAKPQGKPDRGQERAGPDQPQGGAKEPGDPAGSPQQQPGGAKGDKPTDPAQPKGKPDAGDAAKENPPAEPKGNPAGQPDPANSGQPKDAPAEGKSAGQKPKPGQPNTPPAGSDPNQKPKPNGDQQPGGSGQPEGKPGDDAAQEKPAGGGAGKPGDAGGKKEPFKPDQAQKSELDREIGEKNGQPSAGPEDVERLTRDRENLASPDQQKRQQAEKQFDDLLGKKDREKLQQNVQKSKDGGDQGQQQAAKQEADELTKKAADNRKQGNPTPEQVEELKKKADQLASDDPKQREAAEKEFDQKLGEKGRKDLQDAVQKQKQQQQQPGGGKPEDRQAAQEKIDQLAKQAGKNQKAADEAAKKAEELAKKAPDLASKDEKTRKEAEKQFDEQVGKEKREELQKAMQDLQSGDQEKQQAAMDKLKQMADDARKAQGQPAEGPADGDGKGPEFRPGGAGGARGQEEKLLQDDPKNRLKTAELTLQQLEKNRYNDELKKKLGYTDDEYQKFLESYRAMVERMRSADAEPLKPTAPERPEAGRPTLNVSGADRKVEARGGPAAAVGSAGPSAAPPGFADAQRRFAEEAAKLRRQK